MTEDDPLDAETPAPDPVASPPPDADAAPAASAGATAAASGDPPGIRQQVRATREAAQGLVRAHVDLARAEAAEIGGEVKRAAALGGVAFGCLVFLGFLLPIGLALFVGEWLFGSIGWGLLHTTELLIAVVVLAIVLALRVPGVARAFLFAAVLGLVLVVVLGPSLSNELWRRIGESVNLGVEVGVRPLVVGLLAGAAAGALLGLVLGLRAGGGGAAVGGLVGGAIAGAVLGAFSAITFGWRVGAAVGVAVGLLLWPAFMGLAAARSGIDGETLKARFWPQATIDMTKETIEWAKARSPRRPKS